MLLYNSMEPIKTTIQVGKYTFIIIDNTASKDGQIYSRNFKIGGGYADCVNVSVIYDLENNPSYAKIVHATYDPECSVDVPLDRGEDSITMIKTLLQYVHQKLPTLKEIGFEDSSNIECAAEDEIAAKGSLSRKRGTYIYPVALYYFSIAFNGKTWYEKNFNARQEDHKKHAQYKDRVNILLNSKERKTEITFIQFCKTANVPLEIMDELNPYYTEAETFGEFFQSMPKIDRCRLVRGWISTFMTYHLKGVFSNNEWMIDLPISMSGGKNKTRKYYLPKGKIRHTRTYKDLGIDSMHV